MGEQERPIVKLSLDAIEVEVREVQIEDDDEVYTLTEFNLFGCRHHICPDHLGIEYDIKTCFLDSVITRLEYAFNDDKDLSPDARELKQRILDSIKIVRR